MIQALLRNQRYKCSRKFFSGNASVASLEDAVAKYPSASKRDRRTLLTDIFIPQKSSIHNIFNSRKGSISCAMLMRDDVIEILASERNADFKALDSILKSYLAAVFTPDALTLKRITYDTSSGNILESVARGEAVHSVRSLSELKRRLHNGRRCFAYFHSSLENEPLAFIHIALTPEIAPSLSYINANATENNPTHAMFYSVNSPHNSLGGLDLATKLIKEAATEVSQQFPTIKTLSTLSPIPEFMNWLTKASKEESLTLPPFIVEYLSSVANKKLSAAESLVWLVVTITDPLWGSDTRLQRLLAQPLMWLGCHYITREKIISGGKPLPLDPVARFHLRNGASFHELNWMGNPSTNGLKSSAGMMVNYLYDMSALHQNTEHLLKGDVQHSFSVKKLLSSTQFSI